MFTFMQLILLLINIVNLVVNPGPFQVLSVVFIAVMLGLTAKSEFFS